MAEHPDFEALAGYWLGEALAAAAEEIEEHFFSCARCAGHLEWLASLAAGVRAAVRTGALGLTVPAPFVEAMKRSGLRLREYGAGPGATVNCTIRAEDDAVVSRLRAPLAGVTRVDLLQRVEAGGAAQPEERLADVPFDAAAGEVVFIPSAAALRAMPDHQLRVRLVAVGQGGDSPLGEYQFRHTAPRQA